MKITSGLEPDQAGASAAESSGHLQSYYLPEASETIFQTLIVDSPVPSWVSFQDRVVFINAAAVRMLGARSPAEILGGPVPQAPADGPAQVTHAVPYLGGTASFVTFPGPSDAQRRAENIFRAIGESLDYGIWVNGADGKNLFAGESFLKLLGITQDECSAGGALGALRPENAAKVKAEWAECVREGKNWRRELPFRGADGRWHTVLTRGACFRSSTGEIGGWAGTLQDADELGRVRQQLEDAQDSVERSDSEQERFAYTAGHDLQEPLRIIRLLAHLVGRKYAGFLDAEGVRHLTTIEETAQRMTGLVGDLLAYALLLHRHDPPTQVASLDQALQLALSSCGDEIAKSGAVVRRSPLPIIICDSEQMTRVFENLISNALKYRREAVPEIDISADLRGPEWRICVADNGQGIPAAMEDDVFRAWKRLHKNDVPGSGFGLAVCKKIVERHGGRIWVESNGGEGSRFCFTIPVD